MIYIQHGYDGGTRISIGGKYYEVPAWLACEWDYNGGIRSIINTWQGGILRRYRRMDCEDEAIANIEAEARALRYYHRNHKNGRIYAHLSETERLALDIEHLVMRIDPHLRGEARYRRVAELVSRRQGYKQCMYGWRHIKSIIEEAALVVADIQQSRELSQIKRTIRLIREHAEQIA